MTDPVFDGKAALVTGAARGIGRASAYAFGRRGADVLVCDVLEDDAAETVETLTAMGVRAHFQRTDVSDPQSVQAAVAAAVMRFGRLDFAHNNAGTSAPGLAADLDEADWGRVIAVNLNGIFYGLKYQLPEILKTGGAIVNTASIWGLAASAGQAAYTASKHGVVGLTKAAAAEYGGQGVRINAVAPGPIDTAMTAAVPTEIIEPIIGRTALKRFGQPDEIGEAVAWLCQPESSYVNGAVLPVDGGWIAV